MVTIKQIAERAGVSTATVSNVIHGKTKKVSPETVERVQHLIDEMGYVQRMGLRVLRNDSSQLVAVIINSHHAYHASILSDPFYGHTIGIIEEELRKKGYYMMFYSSPEIEEIFKMVMTWDVDGVIAISFPRSDCEKIRSMVQKPVVAIDAHGKPSEQSLISNIGLNDAEGAHLMTRYLFDKGYEAVFVCGFSDFGIDHERWLGAQRVLLLPEYQGRGLRLQFIKLGTTQEEREAYHRQMLRQLPFSRRTAFFFTSDLLAMEANSFFAEQGVRIPDDFGIAGFDDTMGASKFCTPRLTTIRQDIAMKGKLAVRNLVAMLENPSVCPESLALPVSLVIRSST